MCHDKGAFIAFCNFLKHFFFHCNGKQQFFSFQGVPSEDIGNSNHQNGDDDGDDQDNDENDDDDKDSNISGLSSLSGDDWKPTAGPMAWIQRQAMLGETFCFLV